MRETLGFTREQLDALTKASIPRRHGSQLPIAAPDRLDYARMAHKVVAAFVAHVASRSRPVIQSRDNDRCVVASLRRCVVASLRRCVVASSRDARPAETMNK